MITDDDVVDDGGDDVVDDGVRLMDDKKAI